MSSNTQNKNTYINSLVAKFKDVEAGKTKEVNIDLSNIDLKKLTKLLLEHIPNQKKILKLTNNVHYPLNDRTLNLLSRGKIDWNSTDKYNPSDEEIIDILDKDSTVTLIVPEGEKTRAGGSFFKYRNRTHFDFSKYGCHKKVETKNYHHNCLYIALRECGMSRKKLQLLRLLIKTRHVNKCELKNICNELSLRIRLTSIRKDGDTRVDYYGDPEAEDHFNIGLYDDHYFINDRTNLTAYCLENYTDVMFIDDCNKIYMKDENRYKRSSTRYIDAVKMFQILLSNKDVLLEPITYNEDVLKTQFYDKVDTYDTLDYTEKSVKKQEMLKQKEQDYYKVYFDFETFVRYHKDKTNKHVPYLCRYETEDGIKREFVGIEKCALDMLNNLPHKPKIMLIAHNSNYDCRFLLKYLRKLSPPIDKNNKFIQIKGEFHRYNDYKQPVLITIKDSYRLIPMALHEFGECFNLDVSKEVMPYAIYNEENIQKEYVPITEAIEAIKKSIQHKYYTSEKESEEIDSSVKQLISNIDKWGCKKNGEFNIITYSSKYCELDCTVLRKGYETYRSWMLEITQLDIDYYITIQSLAGAYKLLTGCYDGVYMFSGIIQHYISNCIVGGRCMTNSNKMYHVKGKIADFDACSLYPSAMRRIAGYLKGKPKILDNTSYNFLKGTDGYFVRIKILKLHKRRQFPLLSKFNDDGVRVFSNEMEGEIVYIDKTGLEDLIQFHNAEFEIIDGYYFDEGRNNKINETIQHLYDTRIKFKNEKNPAQVAIKLLMNSMYGKTILKPIETKTIIKDGIEAFNKYVSYNYNHIESITQVGDRYFIKKVKSIMSHYNYCHCGVEILSMSKRIMNEVMTLAEDLDLNIYYQDTDSMHINYDEVEVLKNQFKAKYGRDLVGKKMGQFHIDFEMDGAKKEIYAIECYFLGKKVYYDKLESEDKHGKTIHADHIRMRGIPTPCIKYKSKQEEIDVMGIYENLYKGGKYKFDLTNDDNKTAFKFNKDKSVSMWQSGEFDREISFTKTINNSIELIYTL